jgi:hypothetical protein
MLSFLLPDSPETPALLLASTSQVCTFSSQIIPFSAVRSAAKNLLYFFFRYVWGKEEKRATREPRGLKRSAHEERNPPEQMENCEIGAGIPWWNAIRIIPDVSGTQSRSCA